MIKLTEEFSEKIIQALLAQRENFDGSDVAYAEQYGLNKSVFNRIKKGGRKGLISDGALLTIGRKLEIFPHERLWNMARTEVYNAVEEDILFCKEESKSRILVDDVGIGKSYSAKYLSKKLKNCFYIDAKQARSKNRFIKLLAKSLGVDSHGNYNDIKEDLKYYIKTLPKPMIIIDDSGYLDYNAYLELLELWEATENFCGWYQIGDDSLREKLERGINNKKVGYKAIFSRYTKRYTTVVPIDNKEKIGFYRELIRAVLTVNMTDKTELELLVNKCLKTDDDTSLGDLRRAESLLILRNRENRAHE